MSSTEQSAMPPTAFTVHEQFRTIGTKLDRSSPGWRLYSKAKRHGTWDPAAIDLTLDREQFRKMQPHEQEWLMRITAVFASGEESVTHDLLPLMMVIAKEGRIEEELFLTTFLADEAKHCEFFARIVEEVFDPGVDLTQFHGPSYHRIFYEALPADMSRLLVDPSPVNQAIASTTYNMMVEAVLADTGQQAYHKALQRNGLLPGICEGVSHMRRDESRHIAYGIFLLTRLAAENDDVWPAIKQRMKELMPDCIGVVQELSTSDGEMPFGIRVDDFSEYAMTRYQLRIDRIRRAVKERSLEEVERLANEDIESDRRNA